MRVIEQRFPFVFVFVIVLHICNFHLCLYFICIQLDICRQQTGASAGARVSFVVPRSERRGGRDTPMGFVTVAATRRMEVILLLLLIVVIYVYMRKNHENPM